MKSEETHAPNSNWLYVMLPSKKTVRMPLVTRRLRDPDINPCLSILFCLLNDASLMSVRNLMLPPDVWMKITMTRKGVPFTS
ncbi:PREDICTED: coiled-coil-helix-coiled-coil-helix domain-containing protein 7 isoform X4 [Colobus angolensis palliatus]|uniref:coiled-coil-helix-coiled-coil-helix domain-containing protein 7 isoform X4 n=2 Tax=Colobus angolensis palliatus TaxID=336983 RepID=UPI0005F3A746|nr:PREDICTED: coiled-coil-helix-coiled-coil-helix domain-containing protein 7 isoform X4 [Colobus angolensis palliatus]